MSKELKIQVLLSAMDKLTAPFKNAQKATQQLASVISEQRGKVRELQKAFNQNEAQVKKYASTLNPLKAKLSENTSALSKAYAEQRRMEKALKGMSNPTAAFTQKLTQARKNVAKLKDEQAKTVAKLRDARAEFAKNGFSASEMGNKQRELSRRIKQANAEIDKQREKLSKLNAKAKNKQAYQERIDSLRTRAEQYANIGGRATATYSMMKEKVAAPVVEFASAEQAATNLKVAMMGKGGTVSEDFQKINDLAMQLGDKLPGTTADFQNLMTMLVRQGMSAKTILGGTGEAASYLAVQLEMAPEQAAEFAAKMQDATRTTEADMMSLMDIIQKGFYAGVDPTNMLGAFKNLGSAMDTIKIKGLEGAKALAPFVAMFDQAGMDGSASGNRVAKSGDTMTGTLTIENNEPRVHGKKAGTHKWFIGLPNGNTDHPRFHNYANDTWLELNNGNIVVNKPLYFGNYPLPSSLTGNKVQFRWNNNALELKIDNSELGYLHNSHKAYVETNVSNGGYGGLNVVRKGTSGNFWARFEALPDRRWKFATENGSTIHLKNQNGNILLDSDISHTINGNNKAKVASEFALGELNKKIPQIAVIKGNIGNGATLPLPAGYTQAQCAWIVSINADVSLDRTRDAILKYTRTECYVDDNRRVVSQVFSERGTNTDPRTGNKYDNSQANYLVIGVK